MVGKSLLKWGLCTHYVPRDRLEELKRDLIDNIEKTSSREQIDQIISRHAENQGKIELPENYDKI